MRFILVSLFFMGWIFYEMSGGAEFVPPSQLGTQSADAGQSAGQSAGAAEAATVTVATMQTRPESGAIATRSAVSPSLSDLSFARREAPEAEAGATVVKASAPAEAAPATSAKARSRSWP